MCFEDGVGREMLIGSAAITRCLGLGGLNPRSLYGAVPERGASVVGFLVRPLCPVRLSFFLHRYRATCDREVGQEEGRGAGGRRMFLFSK